MTRQLFTEIAGVYDRMNHLLSLGRDLRWRKIALGSVTVRPARILDLACGTGDMTAALARRFPTATVVGADLTPAMLDEARRKISSPQITFVEANAERLTSAGLPFAPGTCDLVTCAFGFRNFADRPAALREVRRMMSAGGELLVLEFFRPRYRLLHGLTAAWLALLARCFVPSKAAAYAYLRASMRTMISEEAFSALAADCGLTLISRRFLLPCCSSLLFRAP